MNNRLLPVFAVLAAVPLAAVSLASVGVASGASPAAVPDEAGIRGPDGIADGPAASSSAAAGSPAAAGSAPTSLAFLQDAEVVGANKCTNGECHTSERNWWKNLDGSSDGYSHEQAIRRLDPRQEQNAGRWAEAMGQQVPFEPSGVCVRCHTTVVRGQPVEGVSCERCHGAGSLYLESHDDQVEGEAAKAARRQASIEQGLRDVYDSPDQWAPLCFECHVISEGPKLSADEAEELILAGHPPGRGFSLEAKWSYVYGQGEHWKEQYSGDAVAASWQPLLADLPALPEAEPVAATGGAGGGSGGSGGGGAADPPAAGGGGGSGGGAVDPALRGQIRELQAEVRRLRGVIQGMDVPGPSAPPTSTEAELPPPARISGDPLPRGPVGALAAVQGQLIRLLSELLERDARTPIRVTPPEEELDYTGPDAELLRLQEDAIRLAIRALGVEPAPPEEDADGDS